MIHRHSMRLPRSRIHSVFYIAFLLSARPAWTQGPSSPIIAHRQLPRIFSSVLPKIETQSRVPILLPEKLPEPVQGVAYAVVGSVNVHRYSVSLYYKLGIGDAGFAALFAGEESPRVDPSGLGTEVKLARGTRGFFRPASCGGSWAPTNLWWRQDGVQYSVQLKLPPSLSEENQQKLIVAVADSAILAGPR